MRLSIKISIVVLLALSACNKSANIPIYSPEFVNHISAYTSGVVDRGSRIHIILSEPVKYQKRAKIDANDLVAFSPSIKGEAKWVDDRTIEFAPEEDLPRGTIFHGVFYLGEIKKLKRELRKFPFRFETRKQFLSLSLRGISTYPDDNPRYRYVKGSVSTVDPEELEDIKKCLSANIGGRKVKIDWQSHTGNTFHFQVDSLERGEYDQQLMFKLKGKPLQSISEDVRTVKLAGMGIFGMQNIEVTNEPDQKIDIYFSESLNSMQSLIGLIQLDSQSIETYELNGNKVTLYPKERLEVGDHHIWCSKDIQNYAGYRLKKDVTRTAYIERTKPKLRLVGKGVIVPDADGIVFPFEAMALKAVDIWIYKIYEKNIPQFLQVNDLDGNSQLSRVGTEIYKGKVDLQKNKKVSENEWGRYTLNLQDYISKEPGAIYRILLGYRSSYTFFDCKESGNHGIDNDGMYYEYYNGENNNLSRYTPCDYEFYYSGSICRNVLASDIGMIVKKGGDDKTHVFTSSLVSANPLANTRLDFYTYQNKRIKTGYTDHRGMAEFKLPEEAYMVVATSGNQKGYLKLGNGRNNSTSKFDVQGVNGTSPIDGKIYTERGVWRPGDSIYLCFTLQDKQRTLPKNVPVTFTLTNPRGQVVQQYTRTSSVGSVYDFRTKTSASAPTGHYSAKVAVGNNTFYKTLSIETVKPNRLKIGITVPDSVIHASNQAEVHVKANWLHGAPAPGLKYNVKARIRRISHPFKKFRGYVFHDNSKKANQNDIVLSEGELDKEGNKVFKPNFQLNDKAPGFLKVDFLTKVFEKGGNFSQDYSTYPIMTYESYVGIKPPRSTNSYDNSLETDTGHRFNLVNLNADGKALSGRKLQVKVYKIDWRWWWDNHGDVSTYMQSNSLFPVVDTVVTTSAKGQAQSSFRLPYPNWGRFIMVAKDPVSKHTSTHVFYVDWPYWRRGNRNKSKQAKTIMLTSDKKSYGVNETVKITVPSSERGKALVCIENGSSVLKKFWVSGTKDESQFTFKTTSAMTPNVYVHVTYLQTYQNKDNDLPARLYGILPIKVENKRSHLYPQLIVEDEIRPDRNETVYVAEKSGRPMTYTLAVVDEGLLDLTHFKTPKLWNHFYQKQRLGVRTWDMYDDVMGGYAGKYGNVLSVGGDEEGAVDESVHKANRFKPAVKFLGPFYLKPGQRAKHQIKMGDYIGAVRMMVIARHHDAYGETEKSVKVKKPIMVLPTLPRVLSPGERIQIPVTVFSITDGRKKVEVSVDLSQDLILEGSSSKVIEFAKPGDETIFFKARVREQVGVAQVKVKAQFGEEVATKSTEIAIRTPNPTVYDVSDYVVEKGKSLEANVKLTGLNGTNGAVLEVSTLPPLNLHSRLDELLQYPHGCVEQTTSSVFAQLFLDDLLNLTEKQQFEVGENVQAAIRRLYSFQCNDGGLSYWPGGHGSNEWGSNYAGHFLVLAQQKGYHVNQNFMNNWLNYQELKAKQYSSSRNVSADHTQAYRLYTLVLAGRTDMASMNRMRENKSTSFIARWRLAAAYAMAGMPEVADQIVKTLEITTPTYARHGSTFGSALRDKAMILETLNLMKQDTKAAGLIREVAEALSSNHWLSTQETAYSLISVCSFYKSQGGNKPMVYKWAVNGKGNSVNTGKVMVQNVLKKSSKRGSHTLNIKNNGESMLFVRVLKSYVPMQSDTNKVESNLTLKVHYEDYNGKKIDPKKLEVGTEFKAVVKVKNGTLKGHQTEIALSFMVPVGWEIENTRLSGNGSGYDHQDFRDDRVYTYFGLSSGQERKFEVRLTASYQGYFYQPTISAENMYDHSVLATQPGGWVEVVEQRGEMAME
jgi:uncharacterized protein YfaS (alpha-2-macroglobulin family)